MQLPKPKHLLPPQKEKEEKARDQMTSPIYPDNLKRNEVTLPKNDTKKPNKE